ncbi:hypothetical protein evm_014240 [Chilo suppressalis]|nr:hypothetical protein evm_014240 [Chilo suppressalis]
MIRMFSKPTCKEDERYWHKLEEMLLQVAQGSVPMIFKPTVDLYTETSDTYPIVPQGEPVQISITLKNPLKISLLLKDVELLWQFTPNTEDVEQLGMEINNEPLVTSGNNVDNNIIVGKKIKSILLNGDSDKILTFLITPLRIGQLNIHGLAYKLINAGEGGNENANAPVISGKVNLSSSDTNEKRLQIKVIPEAPCLQMTFTETCTEAISNELRTIDMELRNVGPVDMKNVHIAVSHPDCITLITEDGEDDITALYEEKYREIPQFTDERAARAAAWRATCASHARPAASDVPRGACARLRLLLRPRALPALHLLAYYETGDRARPYRLLRHVFRFHTSEAVEVSVTPRRCLKNIDGTTLENMFLAVELKNVCGEKEQEFNIEVLEASLFSRQWRFTGFTTVANRVDMLASHERLHLIFKAQRILENLPEGKVEHTCLKLNEESKVNLTQYYKYISDFKPSFLENMDLPTENPTKRQALIQSMFVIRWRARNKTVGRTTIGQHCLWLDCFTKAASRKKEPIPTDMPALQLDDSDNKSDLMDPKQKNRKDNVVFQLEHTNMIQHNFKQRRLCLVPITINLVNCYEVPVKVFIDMSKQQNRESIGELGWAGALSNGPEVEDKKLGVSVSLARFESRRVEVRALCAAPGTYLVGSAFTVTSTKADNQQAVTNISNNTSLLVVQQAA